MSANSIASKLALAGGVLLVTTGAALGADLDIMVHGVKSDEGHVLVAVCTPETFLGAGCPYTARAPAAVGTVALTVPDIPPGTYAVQAFHDANDNFDIDRNLLGLPREGMGFSNDAPMRFGPPKFDDAAIEIDGVDLKARLKMRYFGSK